MKKWDNNTACSKIPGIDENECKNWFASYLFNFKRIFLDRFEGS